MLGGELAPATAGPVIGPYREVRDEVTKSLDAMLTEGQSPEDGLAGAVANADRLLQDYNARDQAPGRCRRPAPPGLDRGTPVRVSYEQVFPPPDNCHTRVVRSQP